jgi:DNA helicase II / ATP-dependent DNA helicase PcrA
MIKADKWKPIGIPGMEDAALRAVRSETAASVVAGPGAGKTELLAQRVCFLLQTGACPTPRRILAISFKRDAASNLQNRVRERAGALASRFDSFTFDAFSKSIVDRFLPALPPHLRPTDDYEIVSPRKKDVERFLQTLKAPPSNLGTSYQVGSLDPDAFVRDYVVGGPLSVSPKKPKRVETWAAQQVWKQFLKQTTSQLTFPMIGRLAEQLLRILPAMGRALRETYSYVLLDEFQDTTHVQYDFLCTAFLGSTSILTAVGDHRQRIMGWAMALDDAFARFEKDFKAKHEVLLMNYRSSPELVRIQEFLIRGLDPSCAIPTSAREPSELKDHCQILIFPNHGVEARYLAARVKATIKRDGVSPRDICILVKQKAEVYAPEILAALEKAGIRARNESELQDLLTEPVAQMLIAFVKLAVTKRAPTEWAQSTNILALARRVDSDSAEMSKIESEVVSISKRLKQTLPAVTNASNLEDVLRKVVRDVGESNLKAIYHQYRRGTLFSKLIVQLSAALWRSYESRKTWPLAVDDLVGKDVLPLMTIHKSKGLEYHTVVFVGLEDSAFWNYKKQSGEDTCTFFVAFSRAKERVLFTFSRQRTTRATMPHESQSASAIRPLYDLLKAAGVKQYGIERWPPPSKKPA